MRFTDGSPVRSGSVELRHRESKETYSSRIATDGGFLPADDRENIGVPPGEYDVVVVQVVLTEDLKLSEHDHGGTVPRRYADYYTSGLRVRVGEGSTDPIEVEVEKAEPEKRRRR